MQDKLASYAQSDSYLAQLLSHVGQFHAQYGDQVIRYVFADADKTHEAQLKDKLCHTDGLVTFSQHLLGGYQAYVKPNLLVDNSLRFHNE